MTKVRRRPGRSTVRAAASNPHTKASAHPVVPPAHKTPSVAVPRSNP